MPDDIELLSTPELLAVYKQLRTTPSFLRQLISPSKIFSEKQEIEFDMESNAYGLAPFVRSNAPGMATRGSGWYTQRMSPAYIKLLDTITVADNTPYWYAGERPWSSWTYQERFDLMRAAFIARHSNMIDIRMEWMMAQLLRTGGYDVKFQGRQGQIEDTYTLDFGRDPSLDVAPGVLWDQPTATPVSDLTKWFRQVSTLSQSTVKYVVTGQDVPEALVKHEDFNDINDRNSGILHSAFRTEPLRFSAENAVEEFGSYKNVSYFMYSGEYHKADGTREPFIKPNEVLIICQSPLYPTAMEMFGKIRDMKVMDENLEVFQKEREVWDPSGVELLTQSSPLTGTLDANLVMRATVLP